MKAIGYRHNLNILKNDSLIEADVPLPMVETNDLLVKIKAISVNPVDVKVRKGAPAPADTLKILGWDACGEVIETGNKVSQFKAGDRVWYAGAINRQGSNAEFQVVDARLAAIAPTSLSVAEAAAMPLTALTAWESLFERLGYVFGQNDTNAKKSLLVINGSGGVGSIVLQLARLSGISVTTTASRQESVEWCYAKGAEKVIAHNDLTNYPDNAFDRILCCHDTDNYFDTMTRLVAPQGLICALSSASKPHDLQPLMAKSAGFLWEFMFTRSSFQTTDMARQGEILTTVASLIDEGKLVTTLTSKVHGFTVENLKAMHAKQEAGGLIGKQVLEFE